MKEKVLVIGIDALDPKIINKLIDKLPNFKSLETYSKLQSTIPPETPVAWSTASTGTNPGKHSLFDFIDRDVKTYLPKLNLAREKPGIMKTEYVCTMQGIPFWEILNENNIKSTIIRWPVTFPAKELNGKMLSGLGVVDIKGTLNNYSYYSNEKHNETEEGIEKIIPVSIEDNRIKTYISGPLVRKGKELIDKRTPLEIEIKEDEILLFICGKEYKVKVGEWSEIIKVKFKINFLMEVDAIFNVFLSSTKPNFKMYMSSRQIDPENQIVNITYPKEYGKELVDNIGLFYTLGMPEDTNAVNENRLKKSAFLKQIKQIEREREKMFFYEFNRFEEGVLAFVFDSGDRLQHIFWENELFKDTDRENYELIIPKEIEEYYIEKDKFLGKVLSKMDESTKLIIFSDHGFNNFERQVNINSWLIEQGYMVIKDNKELPLFGFVDWEKTKAYSIGFTSTYLNLKGRESKGIVDEIEKERLTDEIIVKLKELEDRNQKVFTSVHKSNEIYKGKYANLAPDIVVGFSPGYRMSWKNAVGALNSEIISDNEKEWKGDHLMDRIHVPGVLFTNFKINKEEPEIMDISPTILKLFNIGIPDHIDGNSLV